MVNQSISLSMFLQGGSHNIGAVQNRNVCFICSSLVVDKCCYGGSPRGIACDRLLCLAHIMEIRGNFGRCFFCHEHFQRQRNWKQAKEIFQHESGIGVRWVKK